MICDLALPFLPEYEGRQEILDRIAQSPVDFISLTMGIDHVDAGQTVRNIGGVREMIRKAADRMIFCKSVEDIRTAKMAGKLGVGFHFQGIGALEGDSDMVALYYDLGIRHMLLVYNQMNAAATGCHERIDAGLSRFGQRLVSECNRVGMILDCTHTGYRATMEIMERSDAPVMFSHSNARTLLDHERNITDEQALACARTGGIVGVTGVGKFLSVSGTADVEDLMRHICYFVDLIGPDHIGLGIDYVYFLEQHYRRVAAHPERWPKGYPPPPWHYFAPEQVEGLVEALVRTGLTEAQCVGVLGENFLRIAGAVWR